MRGEGWARACHQLSTPAQYGPAPVAPSPDWRPPARSSPLHLNPRRVYDCALGLRRGPARRAGSPSPGRVSATVANFLTRDDMVQLEVLVVRKDGSCYVWGIFSYSYLVLGKPIAPS